MRFVFLSTDQVLDGRGHLADEAEGPGPVNDTWADESMSLRSSGVWSIKARDGRSGSDALASHSSGLAFR